MWLKHTNKTALVWNEIDISPSSAQKHLGICSALTTARRSQAFQPHALSSVEIIWPQSSTSLQAIFESHNWPVSNSRRSSEIRPPPKAEHALNFGPCQHFSVFQLLFFDCSVFDATAIRQSYKIDHVVANVLRRFKKMKKFAVLHIRSKYSRRFLWKLPKKQFGNYKNVPFLENM